MRFMISRSRQKQNCKPISLPEFHALPVSKTNSSGRYSPEERIPGTVFLLQTMPVFVQSEKEAEDMQHLGFTCVTTLTEAGVQFGDVTLYRTNALHGDGVTANYYYQKFGLPAEACGVVFHAAGEKNLYVAGDTLWYDGVRQAIETYRPGIIALNAANAQMYDGTPILMGVDGVKEVAQAAPNAILIATHMDAVNHARVSRSDLKKFVGANGLEQRLYIPDDGEVITL